MLEQEIEKWKAAFQQKQKTIPELTALLILKVSPASQTESS